MAPRRPDPPISAPRAAEIRQHGHGNDAAHHLQVELDEHLIPAYKRLQEAGGARLDLPAMYLRLAAYFEDRARQESD